MRTVRPKGPTLEKMRASIDNRLRALIAQPVDVPEHLQLAMRHTLLAPAKRIRAALVLIAARHWDVPEQKALDAACAVEMVHTASLILDDLPCMDNAMLRRGIPANHRVYTEATAILAAIGLLSRSFAVVMEDERLDAAQKVRICKRLSIAVGPGGLVSGQELDLHGNGERTTLSGIERINSGKTGSLFAAAAEIGAILGGANDEGVEAMTGYGNSLGLAFQTLDDVLDAWGTEDAAGKDVRKDDRPTLVSLLGLDDARQRAKGHIRTAMNTAKSCGTRDPLAGFALHVNALMEVHLVAMRQPVAV
jgi:geranylgeranyl diphosphate synthase, type II